MNKLASITEHGQFLWQHWWADLMERLQNKEQADAVNDDESQLLTEITEAKEQWQCLQRLYNEVSDPRVVDHVIHQMIATEKRYGYLLQLAKERYLRCDEIEIR